MFMKRNLMKITIMTSETGHVSLVFECTRVAIFNWTGSEAEVYGLRFKAVVRLY